MNFKYFFSFIFLIFILFSCDNNPLNVQVEKKDLDINYIDLDSIFANSTQENIIGNILKEKLISGQIIDYELGYCLKVGILLDPETNWRIKEFTNDPYIKRVEDKIKLQFKDKNKIKAKINSGFLHLNHHFPSGKLPKNIILLNSLFTSNVFCTENEIGIGLERYLGPKTDVIEELPNQEFFQWIKDGMLAEFLERDVLTAWIMTHYVKESKSNTADAMITWGKIIYLTEAAFPEEPKNIIIRYSKKDYDWALENEYSFWKYLVNEKLLFSENERDQANFLNEAPFTIGLPEKGPDRLGQFLGWRMIQSYMKQFPETKLEDLIKLPYTKILQEYEVD